MNLQTACPDPKRLQGLLQGNLSADEQAALTEHIGDCSACQQALDQLASGGPTVAVLREVEPSTPTADSAYWSALAKLDQEITRPGTPPPSRAPEARLDFLPASDDASHLGRLDQFAILGIIGRGGMGIVLRGFDTYLEREVAVKVLDPAMAQDEMARKRFCRESRTAASVTHENVVAVHHVAHEESSDLPYLVMQLIDGESLDQRLARGRLPLKDIVGIGAQVAAGLAAAHEKGLIHRDVKPANVLLERGTNRVKLTDFGLARAADDVRLTGTGLVTGTPLYMAPEQARGEDLDARADLFSLGVLLYELCTGQTPFEARTPLAVLKRLTDEPHQPVRELNPETPSWLAGVIDHLLAKSPADRFQSAREVAEILDLQWSAMKTSSDAVPICPLKRAQRLRLLLIIVAALAAGAVVTGVATYLWLSRGPRGLFAGTAEPPLAVLRGNAGTVWGVGFSPGDRTLAMALEEGMIKLWDVETGTVKAMLQGHRGMAWTAAFSGDGLRLATSGDDNSARLWDLATNKTAKTLPTSAAVRAALFDRDAKLVYTGDRQGHIRVWDATTGEEVRSWQHPGPVFGLALAPDGKTVASAGTDRVVRLWDTETGQERLSLSGHTGPVYSLSFRRDGKVLASAGWDRTVRLWDTGTGELMRTLEGHGKDIWAVDFAPDGNTLASGGQDGVVRVWDAGSGQLLAELAGHDGTVHSLAYSRDGSRIASGGRDGTVHLWKAALIGPGSAEAAGDVQRLAGDPARLGRGEEDHRRGDVLRPTDAAERGLGDHLAAKFAPVRGDAGRCGAFRLDHAGVDRVHADLARPQLLGQRPGHRVHGGLGGAVDRGIRDPIGTGQRADVDDAAAVGADVLDGFLRRQDQAEHVEIELAPEVLHRHLFERGKLVDAGVVDQAVELAEGLRRFGEQTLDILRLGHVRLDRDRFAAVARDRRDDAVGTGLAGGIVDHHSGPLVGEVPGDRGADPLGSARHEGDLASQLLSVGAHDRILSEVMGWCERWTAHAGQRLRSACGAATCRLARLTTSCKARPSDANSERRGRKRCQRRSRSSSASSVCQSASSISTESSGPVVPASASRATSVNRAARSEVVGSCGDRVYMMVSPVD